MDDLTSAIRQAHRDGKFAVDQNGLLPQDFHSVNGRFECKCKRIGSGYLQGYNLYLCKIDGKEFVFVTLQEVYKLALKAV